ncbi:hypothetical protein [Bradyrhizobium cytisi]|uniref:Uncharacterized protein n=1 Tax=Bradyrhizobium cytisi TaxID=515489 RepID=A0A5S4X3C3_9BRAD|nr:hypothetical protein [Bradyrhizobium cytisi]TYL87463.1 hypothetical protein FXB38_04925 [Bradyrhizobium cytisi]
MDEANALGDLAIMAAPPAKMWKALATISARAHQAYDECSGTAPGSSHDKCLFMSLAVRDFLVEIGYRDATVKACSLLIRAGDPQENEIWSVGLGAPGQRDEPDKFNGHAVCAVPSLELLIDTTIYQAIRPHWGGAVGGMVAINYWRNPSAERLWGLEVIAAAECALSDRLVRVLWLDRPEVNWKSSEDFRVKNERRRHVTKALINAFGGWREH